MKKELITLMLGLSSSLFFSCKEKIEKNKDSLSASTITLSSMEESIQDTVYFKKPQIVVLETTEESLISKITKIAMDDNILFVYDKYSDKLFMFDVNGKYIGRIDKKGNGPEEYAETVDFTIDPVKKQIIILCGVPEKRMYFTYQGEFIKEEKNKDFYLHITTDGKYIYLEDGPLDREHQFYVLNTETGKEEEKFKTINVKNSVYPNGLSLNQGKNILFVRRYDNSIYELKNGEIIEKYKVDFKKHAFPERFITEEEGGVIFDESRTYEYIYSMSNICENDHCIIFYTNRGLFLYDKKKDALTGYKQLLNSSFTPIVDYKFSYYLPVQNTNKIACSLNEDLHEPALLKNIAKHVSDQPDHPEAKKMRNNYPGLLEEIVKIGSQITDESNPVLFIYNFKD